MARYGSTQFRRNESMGKAAKYYFYNTLTGLVKALEGEYTTIDLRNESCVKGKIIFVDEKMNVEMQDVVFFDARGATHNFENFFVNKRSIRYVHIPKRKTCTELIKKQLSSMQQKKFVKPHTFKQMRAKRSHKETVQAAYRGQSSRSSSSSSSRPKPRQK